MQSALPWGTSFLQYDRDNLHHSWILTQHWSYRYNSGRRTINTLLMFYIFISILWTSVKAPERVVPSCPNPLEEGNFLCLHRLYLFLPSIQYGFDSTWVKWSGWAWPLMGSILPSGGLGRLGCLWEPLQAFSTLLQSPHHRAFCLLPWCLFGHGGRWGGPASLPVPGRPSLLHWKQLMLSHGSHCSNPCRDKSDAAVSGKIPEMPIKTLMHPLLPTHPS